MQSIDYIIVGQGIAGSLVAFKLLSQGFNVKLFDANETHNATSVSSGIINPVTGRKLVKSWMYEQLQTSFLDTYRKIEDVYQRSVIEEATIIRHCPSIKDENLWNSALLEEPDYCISQIGPNPWVDLLRSPGVFGGIKGYRVNVQTITSLIKQELIERDAFVQEKFDHSLIEFSDRQLNYKGIDAKKIIFCEGWQAIHNPYFNAGLLEPAKGEALIIRIPDVQITQMLKYKIFIVPQQKDLYWVGSTYAWNQPHPKPTKEKYEYLDQALSQILNVEYEIVDHLAAIRPSSQDRRPLVITHKEYPQLIFFNGLGTKGISMSPYFTDNLIDMLN